MLVFWLSGTPDSEFEGGQYQSEERCRCGALRQLEHWRTVYGRRILWRCDSSVMRGARWGL